MTRFLLAATAAFAVAFSPMPSGNAAECRPENVCDTVCDAVCDYVCDLPCDHHLRVDRCDYIDCTPPYVGCISGYFCI